MKENPFILTRTRDGWERAYADPLCTHYGKLGVSPGACGPQQLKEARTRLSRMFHPDHNQNDAASASIMSLANVACRTLGIPSERKVYDAQLRSTHEVCKPCEGRGFKSKQRGFNALEMLRCTSCNGEGWLPKAST